MTTYGINYRPQSETEIQPSALDVRSFELMASIGLKAVRITFPIALDRKFYASERYLRFEALATRLGMDLLPVLQTDATWMKAPEGRSPAALYQEGYDRTLDFVQRIDKPTIFEVGNEVNLVARSIPELTFGKGQTRAPWNIPLVRQWLRLLKGMHDAIRELNSTLAMSHQVLLTTTTTHFGFLDLARDMGVDWDITGYHTYDKLAAVNYRKFWNGTLPAFDLIATLKSYNRPVCIGEINGGEIYTGGDPTPSFTKMLEAFHDQVAMVVPYTMYDQPDKASPESNFGLRIDVDRAKPTWDALASIIAKSKG